MEIELEFQVVEVRGHSFTMGCEVEASSRESFVEWVNAEVGVFLEGSWWQAEADLGWKSLDEK